MEPGSARSSRWRQWLLLAAFIVVLLAGATRFLRPQFDRRMVGTWNDGGNQMLIRGDGLANGFCARFVESGGSSSSFWSSGPYEVRTSGERFQIVRVLHNRTTLLGCFAFLLAVLNRKQTETVEYEGTIISLEDDVMVLDVKSRGASEYRRTKDAPFRKGPFLPSD